VQRTKDFAIGFGLNVERGPSERAALRTTSNVYILFSIVNSVTCLNYLTNYYYVGYFCINIFKNFALALSVNFLRPFELNFK
jgi:hypothetical protein